MLTKALVKELPKEDSNIFKIRVPLFEDNTNTEVIYDALYCYTPGIYGGINVGDCVYVSFEDDKLNIPVILGKLYTAVEEDYVYANINNLSVSSAAKLPQNTLLGNAVNIDTIYNMMQRLYGVNGFNDDFYLIGDSVVFGHVEGGDSEGQTFSYYTVSGYITSSSKEIVIDITLSKNMDKNISTITCESYNVKLRSAGGYLLSNEFIDFTLDTTNKFECLKSSDNSIRVLFTRENPFTLYGSTTVATNNSPVIVSGEFRFKFS